MISFLAVSPWPLVVAAPLAQVATTAISDSRSQTFTYVASGSVKKVSLAGSFNGWDKAADPMTLQPDGRTWVLTRSVPIGRITYKFVVDNDQWMLDPTEKSISDGQGNENSTRLVLPADFNTPASPNDGVVAQSALRHAQTPSYLNFDQGQLTIRLRTRTNDLAKVDLAFESSVGSPEKLVQMKVVSHDDIFSTYEAMLPWNERTSLEYRFRLTDGSRTFGTESMA